MRGQLLVTPGVCFGCDCTELAACLDPETLEPCSWANKERTFCTVCALIYANAVFQAGAAQLQSLANEPGGLVEV